MPAAGVELARLLGHEGAVFDVDFAPDGERAVSGSRDASVRLWDLKTHEEVATWRGHRAAVWAVVFSPNGSRVASAAVDGTIIVWEVATGARLLTLTDEAEQLTALAFHPDGTQLASGSLAGTIAFWDLQTNRCSRHPKAHEGRVWSVAFSANGRWLVKRRRIHSPVGNVSAEPIRAGTTLGACDCGGHGRSSRGPRSGVRGPGRGNQTQVGTI